MSHEGSIPVSNRLPKRAMKKWSSARVSVVYGRWAPLLSLLSSFLSPHRAAPPLLPPSTSPSIPASTAASSSHRRRRPYGRSNAARVRFFVAGGRVRAGLPPPSPPPVSPSSAAAAAPPFRQRLHPSFLPPTTPNNGRQLASLITADVLDPTILGILAGRGPESSSPPSSLGDPDPSGPGGWGNSAPMHEMCERNLLLAADQNNNKDSLATDKIGDPWNPPYNPCPPCKDLEESNKWFFETAALVAHSRATNIITPDRTPQVFVWVSDDLWHKVPDLVSVLEKDNVRHFLQFFNNNTRRMAWGFVITPETFNFIISENALRCAKVVLEGKAPELSGHRANPNYMNRHGYFPLHEAAERFSVDMIKLLFKYGASANVRTAGNEIIENLLPLHVAVENTCLHKYLEDNLFLFHEYTDHQDYIYDLIQLLCLPEMKIFLDTTRLLAKKTNNLLDELWNYVEDGKLVQTAVLLLAGQKQIRWGTSSKNKKGFSKPDGFETIITRIMKCTVSLKEKRSEQHAPEAGSALECIAFLFNLISKAGEDLDAYIQTHSEFLNIMDVPNVEALERVSSILKDHGFFSNREGINARNLCPFDCKLYTNLGKQGHLGSTEAEKVARNKLHGGWHVEYARNCFFPYWRSVLLTHIPVIAYPGYATADPKCRLNQNKQCINSTSKGPSPMLPTDILSPVGRNLQIRNYHTGNHAFRRLFGTTALTLLKVLKQT